MTINTSQPMLSLYKTAIGVLIALCASLLLLIVAGGFAYMRLHRELVEKLEDKDKEFEQRLQMAEHAYRAQSRTANVLERVAKGDALTGLVNRRRFDDNLAHLFSQWQAHGQPVTLILMDIDHFKAFNDNHGHQAGDSVLSNYARRVRSAVRADAITARYGGEEFAVILAAASLSDGEETAERIRREVANSPFEFDGKQFDVTVSCGVAQAVEADQSPSDLIERADQALYRAKDSGRNRVCSHDGQFISPIKLARGVAQQT